MFSGFFFSQIGSQGTPPAALPGGTGLVVVSDGAGQKLDYGAAYQYARMNAAGTVMQFVDPVAPNGGLVLTSGQLGVQLPTASGLKKDASGVSVSLAATPGLEVLAEALKAKVDASTMQLTSAGIGADASKVAVLSSGTISAANSRGQVLKLYDTVDSALVSVSITAESAGNLLNHSMGSLVVGDVIDLDGQFFCAHTSGTTSTCYYNCHLEITNPSGVMVREIIVYNSGPMGRISSVRLMYPVATAGIHRIRASVWKYDVGTANTNQQVKAQYKIFRT